MMNWAMGLGIRTRLSESEEASRKYAPRVLLQGLEDGLRVGLRKKIVVAMVGCCR